jgi:hypothetical protein
MLPPALLSEAPLSRSGGGEAGRGGQQRGNLSLCIRLSPHAWPALPLIGI